MLFMAWQHQQRQRPRGQQFTSKLPRQAQMQPEVQNKAVQAYPSRQASTQHQPQPTPQQQQQQQAMLPQCHHHQQPLWQHLHKAWPLPPLSPLLLWCQQWRAPAPAASHQQQWPSQPAPPQAALQLLLPLLQAQLPAAAVAMATRRCQHPMALVCLQQRQLAGSSRSSVQAPRRHQAWLPSHPLWCLQQSQQPHLHPSLAAPTNHLWNRWQHTQPPSQWRPAWQLHHPCQQL